MRSEGSFGWICPVCKAVWAPYIKSCERCSAVISDDKVTDLCSCYHNGECWGTKEREKTNCGGNKKRCDQDFEKRNCNKIKSVTYNTGGEVSYDTFNDGLDGYVCINNSENVKSYFKKSELDDGSDWR